METKELAAQIVSAYVSHNSLAAERLAGLVQEVVQALDNQKLKPQPAVPIEASVHDDYLVCLEDGEKVVLLKRYLMKQFGMTPEEYREKWGLPDDYPMVTKNYSVTRRGIALQQGLGKRH